MAEPVDLVRVLELLLLQGRRGRAGGGRRQLRLRHRRLRKRCQASVVVLGLTVVAVQSGVHRTLGFQQQHGGERKDLVVLVLE